MWAWFNEHETLLAWLGVGSVAMFVGTLVALPIVVAAMPADYFSRPREHGWLHGRHPVLRVIGHLAKNALGAALILLGIAMLVLPGQGLLTILVGLALIEFPGKRDLEQRLVRRRQVRSAMDWIRAKAGRPPLEVPGPHDRED